LSPKPIFQRFFVLLIFGLHILSCVNESVKAKPSIEINDSIAVWIAASKSKVLSKIERKKRLIKSYEAIRASKIDSLQLRYLSAISYQHLKLGDTLLFRKRNKEALFFAEKLKDNFALGDLHWNCASFYINSQLYNKAFYHFNLAHRYFDRGDYLNESAMTEFGMAFIKGRFKDYHGSEILIFKAINKFKRIENYKELCSSYNHLGQLQSDIKEYDRALYYYNKAIEYVDKVKNNQYLYSVIYNNIGNVFLEKKEYAEAIRYYDKVLEDKEKFKNINDFARIIDNKAYCRFLMKDTTNVAASFKEVLQIRDSVNNVGGLIISKKHLGEYYAYKQDTLAAINYITEANSLAKSNKNSRDYLETLYLLSIIDHKNSSKYLKKHVLFNDSMQIVERKIQNRFTRIAYETDEYKVENERLSLQKIWILFTSFALISILSLVYFLRVQKSKNENLQLENQQQKANEKIYLITLQQQEKLEKEKIKDRNRIAAELHDGILSKLFGARVGLGFIDIIGSKVLKDKHQLFLDELQIIEKEIREVSHVLSNNSEGTQINFTTIISQLLDNKCKTGNIKYLLDFNKHIQWQIIDEKTKVNLYRILQEALQNILKYAFAENVSVNFSLGATKKLSIVIKDDGVGFEVGKKRKGIGIKNMKSRIDELNGTFHIYSQPNQGTIIEIQMPI